jgi:hypothetical protein
MDIRMMAPDVFAACSAAGQADSEAKAVRLRRSFETAGCAHGHGGTAN